MAKGPVLKLEHKDSRGEIYSITLPGGRELMLLHSVAGSKRGGHAHDCNETILMLAGKMAYRKGSYAGDFEVGPGLIRDISFAETLRDGDVSRNSAGLAHMGEFIEDSWLVEWKIGVKPGEWRNIDYPPYRQEVQSSIR